MKFQSGIRYGDYGNPRKITLVVTMVRLVVTIRYIGPIGRYDDRTRVLLKASPVRYHVATSLGLIPIHVIQNKRVDRF